MKTKLSKYTELATEIESKWKQDKVKIISFKKNSSRNELTRYLDLQKEKLSVYATRLKRYQRSFDKRKDNQTFKTTKTESTT